MRLKGMDQTMVGRPKWRTKNPLYNSQSYLLHEPLYGYYGIKSGSKLNAQPVFAIANGQQYTPFGGAAIALSDYNTNLYSQGGSLPTGERFLIKSISVGFRADIKPVDAIRVIDDTLVVLYIGPGKANDYWRSHMYRTPGGGGIDGASVVATTTFINNGWPVVDNQPKMWGPASANEFNEPDCEILEANQNFQVLLDPTQVQDAGASGVYTSTGDINIHVYLDGIRVRLVQG